MDLHQAMIALDGIYDRAGKIMSYAYLCFSTDTKKYGSFLQQQKERYVIWQDQLRFFDLKWLKLEQDEALSLLADQPELHCKYQYHLMDARKYQDHTLSEPEERIMSHMGLVGMQSWNRFFDDLMSAMRFDVDGDILSEEATLSLLQDPEQSRREKAADALTLTFKNNAIPLTHIFNSMLQDKQD